MHVPYYVCNSLSYTNYIPWMLFIGGKLHEFYHVNYTIWEIVTGNGIFSSVREHTMYFL